MNVKEKELQTKIEERIRIANQLRKVADAMLTAPESKSWDGYCACVIKGLAAVIENEREPAAPTSIPVPGSDHLH